MKTKVGFIDKEWGLCGENKIVGDMSFTFCDRPDTLTTDIERLKEGSLDWINGTDCEEVGETIYDGSQQFAIYLLYEVEVELEDGEDLFWFDIDDSDAVLTGVYACAPKEIAGWIEKDGAYQKEGVTFKYRESC